MECNRDEALRAREIAEGKFAVQDFAGAKKFVLKAQQLYPALEGVAQMLAVMDVHSVAQVKVGLNEMDWYGILQVEPLADDSLIKRQYRKLALLLHPDKNKSIGAEAAFKLIGEAFGVLSDKTKRTMHDLKRGSKAKVAPMHTRVSQTMKPQYPAYHAQYQAAAQAAAQATHAPNPQAPHPSLTFWTSCPLCRMQYQYLRTYVNFQLLCQKCNKPFAAKDINAPTANGGNPYTWSQGVGSFRAAPPQQEFKYPGFVRGNGTTGVATGNGHAYAPGESHAPGVGIKPPGVTVGAAAAAAHIVQETYQRVRKDRVEAEKEVKRREKEKEKALRQQEKEALKRAREEVKSREALERLMSKRKEAADKEAKRKVVERGGLKKRLNKRRRKDEEDDDEENEDEDMREHTRLADGTQAAAPGVSARKLNPRRSLRNRRNVTYRIDGSDDDEEFPASKKARMDGNSVDFGNGNRIEKGKLVIDDDDDDDQERWINGVESDGEVSGKGGHVKEEGSGSAFAKQRDLLAEKFRRDLAAKFRNPKLGLARASSGTKPEGEQESLGKGASSASGDAWKEGEAMTSKVKLTSSLSRGNNDIKSESLNVDKRVHKQASHCADFPDRLRKEPSLEAETKMRPGSPPSAPSGSVSPSVEEVAPISVPDPDFHDFDSDRTEAHVRKDQIWAIFDEQDGMPRYYCKITRVSHNPFAVYGSWLESAHPSKHSMTWLNKYELSLSSGDFKLGSQVDFDQINMFSHEMTVRRCKTLFEVYPRRNEVWAVYRDHDKELPKAKEPGRVQFRYDMVEVRSDFSIVTHGGCVVALAKLEGYKTLWRPVGDVYFLAVEDLQRFSHRVPSYPITERDIPGVPGNCLELDPASTPADQTE